MKHLTLITAIALLVNACLPEQKSANQQEKEYFIENKLSFFDPYEQVYSNGSFQGYTFDTWLRKPENLRMIHETFKKIGYKNLVSEEELNSNPCLLWSYINKPLNQIIDSLIITFNKDTIESKYYREFWERRKNEQNEKVVYEILTEVSTELISKEKVDHQEQLVNDTLYNLILISEVNINPTEKEAYKNFEYLMSVGMNFSAYNLLYERSDYEYINWNREELAKELKKDTAKCCPRAWVSDDTK